MAGYMEKTDLISYWLTAVGLFAILDLMLILWMFWLDLHFFPYNLFWVRSLLFGLELPVVFVLGIPIAIILLIAAVIWFSPPMEPQRRRLSGILSRKERL
jgi:hypothetical protein